MERIGSAVLGIAIIFIGGLMIVGPQFVDILGGIGPYLLLNGLFLIAFGVIKLVNGIEGLPRIGNNPTSEIDRTSTKPRVWKFIPIRSSPENAATDEKVERGADNLEK